MVYHSGFLPTPSVEELEFQSATCLAAHGDDVTVGGAHASFPWSTVAHVEGGAIVEGNASLEVLAKSRQWPCLVTAIPEVYSLPHVVP